MVSDAVIKVKNVNYLGHSNVNWELKRGNVHAIVGPSGVGKSSFLRLFLGLLNYEGEILDENDNPWKINEQNISVQFQNSALLSHLSIGANIYLPLCMRYDLPIEVAEFIAYGYMKKVELADVDFYRLPSECSGGMQKRAALARALVLEPNILFLDEPTSGLDIKSASHYDEVIKSVKNDRKMSIIMVTHDLERVKNLADMTTIILKDLFISDTLDNLYNNDNMRVREFLRYNG